MINKGIPPRVAAIHDLSCLGRSALTAIIPTLSALGCQVIPLPTALLSTQTDGFDDFHFRNLSEDMKSIGAHFSALHLCFDALYTGFLGDAAQVQNVLSFFDTFASEETLILVDPVMGDEGKLYSTCNDSFTEGMRLLIHRANVITPNYTEACFLANIPYLPTEKMEKDALSEAIRNLIDRLKAITEAKIIITGVECGKDILTFSWDGKTVHCHENQKWPENYPGTGDIFASVLLGRMLAGLPLADAAGKACDFVASLVEDTLKKGTPRREGVLLESNLSKLFID